MPEVKWIKLSTTMFDDEKIRLIETMPDADTLLVIWIKLLAQAGKTNASGYIFLNETIPYNDEMLATIFNRPINTVRLALDTFQKFGMIEIDDHNFLNIINWEKHQNLEGLDKIREQTKIRNKSYRERKKQLQLELNRDVTDASHDVIDIDKEVDKEKNNAQMRNDYDSEFDEFWNLYPRRIDKKRAFEKFKQKRKQYSLESILEGTKKYVEQVKKEQTELKYTKYPSTFLNAESFLNEEEEVKQLAVPPSLNKRNDAFLSKMREVYKGVN